MGQNYRFLFYAKNHQDLYLYLINADFQKQNNYTDPNTEHKYIITHTVLN